MKRSRDDTGDAASVDARTRKDELIAMCRRVRGGERLTDDEMARIIAAGESAGIALGDFDPRKYCESILRTVDTAWKKEPVNRPGMTKMDCNVLLVLAKNLDPRDYAKFAQTSKAIYNCLDTGQYNPDETHRIRNMLREKKHAHFLYRFPNGYTGLAYAAEKGDLDLVKLFITPDSTELHAAALYNASKHKHYHVIDAIVAQVDSDSRRYLAESVLRGAAESGNLDLIRRSISIGACNWNNGLAHAALGGHRELVKQFIARGANSLPQALKQAARGGHIELVKYLMNEMINKGDLNPYWIFSHALEGAAGGGHIDLVKYVIENSKKMSNMSYDQFVHMLNRALSEAMGGGYSDIVNLLIKLGAEGVDWHLLLFDAAKTGTFEMVNLTIDKTRDWIFGVYGAAQGGHRKMFDYFFTKYSPEVIEDELETIMEYAIPGGNREIVDALIARGANNWNRYWEHALDNNNRELMDLFIAKGARPNI